MDMEVLSGELTVSSSAMEEPVVVEEGQCMGSLDTDGMSEEEKDALHALFGEWMGEACSF